MSRHHAYFSGFMLFFVIRWYGWAWVVVVFVVIHPMIFYIAHMIGHAEFLASNELAVLAGGHALRAGRCLASYAVVLGKGLAC